MGGWVGGCMGEFIDGSNKWMYGCSDITEGSGE